MRVGRFQVMAMLQAARAYILGLPRESAFSWGLNRAIFYAAAKKGFKKVRPLSFKEIKLPLKKFKDEEIKKIEETFGVHHLGDEMAYSVVLSGKRYFLIGDEIQTEEKFEKQIKSRFGKNFDKAWEEALHICQKFDKGVLLSQRYFYETVYKPQRDELATKWSQLAEKKE